MTLARLTVSASYIDLFQLLTFSDELGDRPYLKRIILHEQHAERHGVLKAELQ